MNVNEMKSIREQYSRQFVQDEDHKHLARMLMYRFLSEVEKITDERNILRKDLAAMIGVSPSYITQLYRGSKPLNFDTLARMETALDFRFEVKAITKELLEVREDAENDWSEEQINNLIKKLPPCRHSVWMRKNMKDIDFAPVNIGKSPVKAA